MGGGISCVLQIPAQPAAAPGWGGGVLESSANFRASRRRPPGGGGGFLLGVDLLIIFIDPTHRFDSIRFIYVMRCFDSLARFIDLIH